MKRKFLAFSISLVLMLLILFGPRHPGYGTGIGPSFTPPNTAIRVLNRGEPAITIVGTPLRLRGIWVGDCGEGMTFEDRLNCSLYLLNHPETWLGM